MKEIRVERQKGYYGMFRVLEILIDGAPVGKINQGQTMVFEAPDSCREIWGKMDWGETHRLNLADYNPSQTVVFKAYFTLNFFRNVGLAKIPFGVFLRDPC